MCMPRELLTWFKLEAAAFCARHLMPFLCVIAALSVTAVRPLGGAVLLPSATEPRLLALSRAGLSCA